jgi:hypothetical protein
MPYYANPVHSKCIPLADLMCILIKTVKAGFKMWLYVFKGDFKATIKVGWQFVEAFKGEAILKLWKLLWRSFNLEPHVKPSLKPPFWGLL